MVDRKHRVELSDIPSLTQQSTFREAAGNDVPMAQNTVAANAKAELDVKAQYEQALNQEEFRRKADRQKLATSSAPSPELGTSAKTNRDVLKEYNELQTASELRKESIIKEHDDRMTDIRENGTTLTKAFEKSSSQSLADIAPHAQVQPAAPTQDTPHDVQAPEQEQTYQHSTKTDLNVQQDFARASAPADIPVHDNTPNLGHSR